METPLTEDYADSFAALQTHKPYTAISNDGGAGLTVDYVADPKKYIDRKFAELAALIS